MDNSNGGISVIVPVYKVRDYIEDSIISVMEQEYDNFEIVLVDDGSPDDSIDIAKRVLCKGHVKYKIVVQENKGLPAARNAGIREAEGEYICFIDSDDIIDRGHLKKLSSAFVNDIEFSFSDFEVASMDNRKGKDCGHGSLVKMSELQIKNSFLNRSIPIHCCATMFRKEFLLNNNLWFNEKLKYGEDVEFLWRLLSKTKNCVHYEEKSYKYLCRPNSLMTNQNLNKIKVFIKEFTKTINNLNEDIELKQKVISRTLFGICHSCAKNSEYTLFKELTSDTPILEKITSINKIGDIRIIALWGILKTSPKLFWLICQHV